ncbi:MAG: putative sulfate exporter family transporter [Cellulosilyticum sp.]|nr:putative sulfate exporter family transporter [Cellulosilyticum sp.]
MDKKAPIGQRVKEVLPGLVVCIVIAIASKIIGRFVPSLGAATISIFLGILVGNVIGKQDKLNKGTKFAESTLLSISVVLLGATLSIGTIFEIGWQGIIFIIIQMTLTIAFIVVVGKKMKFSIDFVLLMASGNSVCGSSAIASCAPVIHASSKDKGIAITMVNVTGTVLMIILPVIASFLYKGQLAWSSALIGGTLQSVGQVVAAGSIVSEAVKEMATVFKIVRIIFLVVVILVLGSIKERSLVKGLEDIEEEQHSHTHQSRLKMPWYIKGFFLLCILYTLEIIPQSLSAWIKNVDNFIEIIALAGIGMRVSIVDLLKQGAKASLFCAYIGLAQMIFAVLLIWILL